MTLQETHDKEVSEVPLELLLPTPPVHLHINYQLVSNIY